MHPFLFMPDPSLLNDYLFFFHSRLNTITFPKRILISDFTRDLVILLILPAFCIAISFSIPCHFSGFTVFPFPAGLLLHSLEHDRSSSHSIYSSLNGSLYCIRHVMSSWSYASFFSSSNWLPTLPFSPTKIFKTFLPNKIPRIFLLYFPFVLSLPH